jgi:signal transduction histidine kinase
MNRNSIRWRLAFSYAAIALLAAFSLGLVLRSVLRSYYDTQEARYLQESAMRIGIITSQLIDANVPAPLIQDQAASWSFFLQARVRIEDASRRLIADSGVPNNRQVVFFTSAVSGGSSVSAPAGTLVQGTDAPLPLPVPKGAFSIQIIQRQAPVGAGEQGKLVVFSRDAIGVSMPADVSMYGLFDSSDANVIVRRSSQMVEQRIINERGDVLGRLILSDGPAYGDEIVNNVMNGLVAAGIVAVLLAAFAGWFFSNRITTPITALTQVTSRMAAGDLTARADVAGNDEMEMLGRSFNEMASQVEEMVGTLRSFVADAAHELHTPLTALQTNLELARDEQNASTRNHYLSRAHEQSQRLEALVRSLLDLSRIEAAGTKFFAPMDIVQLVREVGEQVASRAEQAEREFRMSIFEGPAIVYGNENQLRQVLINLFENAIKFTPKTGSVSIKLERILNEVKLTVADTGIGIPPEDLPHLFERFHRGRNASEYSGNGLGLAIVKAIVAVHGGNVAVESKLMQGTIMVVSIPVYD